LVCEFSFRDSHFIYYFFLESGLHKLRRKALPPLPVDQLFVIPPVYQNTYDDEPFLIYDKRKSHYGGRLLMFASEEQLNVLFQSEVLFADGTFKVCPKLFEQLYVILAITNGEGRFFRNGSLYLLLSLFHMFLAVPVCFALTSNRRHQTYEAMFRRLKKMAVDMGSDFKPSTIVCDFEHAFMNAVEKEVCQLLFSF